MTQPWIDQRLTTAELDAIQAAASAVMQKPFSDNERNLQIYREYTEAANPVTVLRLVEQARLMGWQPIETAPKDGTEIIVLKNGKLFIVDWSTPNGWTTRNGNSITPYGWFPLPKPPEDK